MTYTTFHMISLGCNKNLVDAEIMLGKLLQAGYKLEEDPGQAEIIVINTCGFIESAKQEAIDTILENAAYKTNGACRLLIVTGCLAQRYGWQVLESFPEVDGLCGTGDFYEIINLIERSAKGERAAFLDNRDRKLLECPERVTSTPYYTAYLKIAEGCSNCCTYCAIPEIRGSFRSRRPEDIVKEAERLAEKGVSELIVVAQDITRYGMDLQGRPLLSDLLKELVQIDGIAWIRLHYAYPELLDDQLIAVMAEQPKILHYLDLPLQHCSDGVLKRMGRRSSRMQMESLIRKLRSAMPDIALRTSLITGFPGETEEEFAELLDFVKQTRFDKLGVFAYSKEENTPAAKMKGQIPKRIREKRQKEIMLTQQSISQKIHEKLVGQIFTVLTEAFDTNSNLHIARSYRDSIDIDGKVFFESEGRFESGQFARVLITHCDEYNLYGRAVE